MTKGDFTFGVPEEKAVAWYSPSRLLTAIGCMYQYKRRYLEGVMINPTGIMSWGSSVHKVIETNCNRRITRQPELTLSEMKQVFSEEWSSRRPGSEFASEEEFDELGEQGEGVFDHIEQYIRSLSPEKTECETKKIISDDENYGLRGFIDMVDVKGKIFDFKTTARRPSKNAQGLPTASVEHRFQLTTYAYCESDGGQHEVRCSNVYIIRKKKPEIIEVPVLITVEEMKRHEAHVKVWIEMLRHPDQAFPPNRRYKLCTPKYCPVWDDCHEKY